MSIANANFAAMAEALSRSPDYRILRRLKPREITAPGAGSDHRVGIALDVETTGLDTGKDEIIELGMVKFAYLPTGEITHIMDVFAAFNQPSAPIPADVVELTKITDEMVAGHRIAKDEVAKFVSDAALVIAHNASFDRQFSERYWPEFMDKNWACSATQVEWRKLGFDGSRLGYLLAGCGYFHDGHRAADDCRALIEILASKPNGASSTSFAILLDRARASTVRIWAERAPFDLKDVLKKRRYRWNDGNDGRPRAWYIDIDETNRDAELQFLRDEIYGREVQLHSDTITALTRFSARA